MEKCKVLTVVGLTSLPIQLFLNKDILIQSLWTLGLCLSTLSLDVILFIIFYKRNREGKYKFKDFKTHSEAEYGIPTSVILSCLSSFFLGSLAFNQVILYSDSNISSIVRLLSVLFTLVGFMSLTITYVRFFSGDSSGYKRFLRFIFIPAFILLGIGCFALGFLLQISYVDVLFYISTFVPMALAIYYSIISLTLIPVNVFLYTLLSIIPVSISLVPFTIIIIKSFFGIS